MISNILYLIDTGLKICKYVKVTYTIMGVTVCVYKLYKKRRIPKQYGHVVTTTHY